MLSKDQAQKKMKESLPDSPVQAWVKYKDFYLFRVKFPLPGEEDYDPFFSVDSSTGEVREFSVITDINTHDFMNLEWKNV